MNRVRLHKPKAFFRRAVSLLILFAGIGLIPHAAQAGINGSLVQIPLTPDTVPANDLMYHGRELTVEEALDLERNAHVDLSKLNPNSTTDVWPGVSTASDSAKDQALPIKNGETVKFVSELQGSAPGCFEMDVLVPSKQPGQPPVPMIIYLSATLHNYLLRKEMLRRLGYRVPATKWLKSITVHFANSFLIPSLLYIDLPNATHVSATHFVVNSPGQNPSDLTFQDAFAIAEAPVATRYYNVDILPPVESSGGLILPENRRIMRALAIVDRLTDFPESVNMIPWNFGHIENQSVVFHTDGNVNFDTGDDDAVWILRKIAKFTRRDFVEMVRAANYPNPQHSCTDLIVEKLISQRDSAVREFGLHVPLIPFNAHLNEPPYIKNGVCEQKTVPGYATYFTSHDLQSPVKGLGWYALTEVEGNVLENLFNKINSEIPGLTIAGQYQKHSQQVMQAAFANFLRTGENQAIPLKTWTAPIINGGVSLSRSIVIGNYLGANNLVQLADTASEYLNVGIVVGVDGLPTNVGASGLIEGTVTRSLTHLKPIQPPATFKKGAPSPLKKAARQPFNRVLVDLLFHDASDVFAKVSQFAPKPGEPVSSLQIDGEIDTELEQLKKALGVGDSLILTDSLSNVENATGSYGVLGGIGPGASLTVGGNQLILSRLYIYRPSQNMIQIYKDNGELNGVNLSFEFTLGTPISFPVLMVTANRVAGSGRSKIYDVDISPSDPNIFKNAVALESVFRSHSIGVLASDPWMKPNQITERFHDSSSSFQFFHWVHRHLNLNGDITVKTPYDPPEHYLALLDGSQSGHHYQQLATQVATYIVQRLTNNPNYLVDTQVTPDPGRSFLGDSKTREVTFQSQIEGDNLATPLVQVQYRWEGWGISANALNNLAAQLKQQFHYDYASNYSGPEAEFHFHRNFLGTATEVQLYQLLVNINLYQSALNHIAHMSYKFESSMVRSYLRYYNCNTNPPGQLVPQENVAKCEAIWNFESWYSHYLDSYIAYPQTPQDVKEYARSVMEMANNLERFLPFDEFINLAGGPSDVYVYGVLNGFRTPSEKKSKPIYSQAFGTASNELYPDGIMMYLEQRLGINDGELYMQWMRSFL